MKISNLQKLVKKYFNKNGYQVTDYPEKATMGFYTVKDEEGVTYEISASDTNALTLRNADKSSIENSLLISQIQEL